MSNSDVTIERLVELVEQTGVNLTEVKRAIVEDNDNADLVELAEDLCVSVIARHSLSRLT